MKDRDFKNLLLNRREELEELLVMAKEASSTVSLDQTKVGRLSRMDALQSQAMSQEVTRRRQGELQRIGSALERLKDGEFGYCVTCGEDIEKARLELDPAVPQCLRCAH